MAPLIRKCFVTQGQPMSVIDGIVLPQKLWRPQQILMTTAKGETVQSLFFNVILGLFFLYM